MKKTITLLALVALLTACQPQLNEEEIDELINLERTYVIAESEHVDTGKTHGAISASYTPSTNFYQLTGSFYDLPELEDGYFYEGWLIRNEGELSVVSTGALEDLGGGQFLDTFESEQDYTDHIQYVLTLEPDDGDPAPAEHVLEAEFQAVEEDVNY